MRALHFGGMNVCVLQFSFLKDVLAHMLKDALLHPPIWSYESTFGASCVRLRVCCPCVCCTIPWGQTPALGSPAQAFLPPFLVPVAFRRHPSHSPIRSNDSIWSWCSQTLLVHVGQVPTKTLAKPQECRGAGTTTSLDGTPLPNVVQYIKDGKVDLVINIPEVRIPMPSTDGRDG